MRKMIDGGHEHEGLDCLDDDPISVTCRSTMSPLQFIVFSITLH